MPKLLLRHCCRFPSKVLSSNSIDGAGTEIFIFLVRWQQYQTTLSILFRYIHIQYFTLIPNFNPNSCISSFQRQKNEKFTRICIQPILFASIRLRWIRGIHICCKNRIPSIFSSFNVNPIAVKASR